MTLIGKERSAKSEAWQDALDVQLEAVEAAAEGIRFFEASMHHVVRHAGNVARSMTYDNASEEDRAESLVSLAAAACVLYSGRGSTLYWSLRMIREEALRAVSKHGLERTPANREMDPRDKLAILVEELGEVAEADFKDDQSEFEKELVQLATMAAMWLVSLGGAA